MKRLAMFAAALSAVALFAACGGGGGGNDAGAGGGGGTGTGGGAGGGTGGACPGTACIAGLVCKTSTGVCVQCVDNSNCTDAAKPVCNTFSNLCEAGDAGSGGGAGGGAGGGTGGGAGGGTGGGGGGTPPSNDTCATPTSTTLAADATVTLSTDTTNATDDYSGSCSPTGDVSRDVVFEFVVPAGQELSISAESPSGVTTDIVLYLRSSPCASGTELSCQDEYFSIPEKISLGSASATTTYYLVVETFENYEGAVDLTVTTKTPISGGSCSMPIPLALTNGAGAVTFDTASYGDDYNSNDCSGADGPDIFHSINLTNAKNDLDVYVLPQLLPDGGALDGGDPMDVAIDIIGSPCSSANELACKDQGAGGRPEMVSLRNVDGGTYYLVTDGYGGDMGQVQLKVNSLAAGTIPQNDACIDAIALTTAVPATGTTTRATDGIYGDCGGRASADVAYKVTTTNAGTLNVVVSATNFRPVVYVLDGSCNGTEVQCAVSSAGTPATATLSYPSATAATDYFIVVDGEPAEGGDFTITATVP